MAGPSSVEVGILHTTGVDVYDTACSLVEVDASKTAAEAVEGQRQVRLQRGETAVEAAASRARQGTVAACLQIHAVVVA